MPTRTVNTPTASARAASTRTDQAMPSAPASTAIHGNAPTALRTPPARQNSAGIGPFERGQWPHVGAVADATGCTHVDHYR